VPRDAPSYVDLGAYMFAQTDQFRNSGNGLSRKVATTVSIAFIRGYMLKSLSMAFLTSLYVYHIVSSHVFHAFVCFSV